jgi:Protein of unknown function (DUF3102)
MTDELNAQSTNDVTAISRFDYASVTPSVATFLRGQADRIRRYAAKSVIQIGKDLIAAKRYLCHGAFLHWLESEVGIAARTGQVYMQVAHWAEGQDTRIALLPPSLLYMLSSPSTPKEFSDDVLKRLDGGENIMLAAVREELKNHRETNRKGPPVQPKAGTRSAAQKQKSIEADEGTAVGEAVEILARWLPEQCFTRVRDLMTSKTVLEHPNLAQLIAVTFSAARPSVNGLAQATLTPDIEIAAEPARTVHEDD